MSEQQSEQILQTTCTECESVFNLNLSQLLAADGRVRCSECNTIFDANIHLIDEPKETKEEYDVLDDLMSEIPDVSLDNASLDNISSDIEAVSLHEAMNGDNTISNTRNLTHLYWITGILLLTGVVFIQWVYFNQIQLIKKPNRQNWVLSICSFMPCHTDKFESKTQIKLIERNIFTHPTRANALLISGSFINEAPFSQKVPSLKISLFNLNSEVIAQRIFTPQEYTQSSKSIKSIAPGENIHFKLEVEDPKTVTITYEFEFI
jgi:predicted Zn finger-like uncharacterized protein